MEGDLTTKLHKKHNEIFRDEPKKTIYKQKTSQQKFQWGAGLRNIDRSGKFIKNIAELPSCCTNPNEEQSEIQEFFRDCDVLITGATGFMGKILIEKLLVSCPNIGNIYLIIREKKGKSFSERFDQLFKEEVFQRLYKLVPDFRKKVFAVKGECQLPRMGLSDEDHKMLTNRVSIIFHGAATVRFDETLKLAASINVRGVLEMIKFAKECKFLKSIMHVSTTYSNCTATNHEVTEEFYKSAYDYKKFLDLIETESDEYLQSITKKLIYPWPNTYAFTKQIGEDIVRREGEGLPLGIYRPGIIIATYKEPIRAWSDNIYGPTGVIIGIGTGLLRVLQMDTSLPSNIVPVDVVVNGLIAAAYRVSENFRAGENAIKIFNYVSSKRNPITWGDFNHWHGWTYGRNWPTKAAIWHPFFFPVKNRMLYLLLNFLLHMLPAYAVDAALVLCGQKPRMIKIYQKISRFNVILSFFTTNSWNFTDDNTLKLWNSLSPKDKEIFPFDIADVDWDYHGQAHLLGLRVYLVKDDIETLPLGRQKWARLEIIHRILQIAGILLLSWIIMVLYSFSRN